MFYLATPTVVAFDAVPTAVAYANSTSVRMAISSDPRNLSALQAAVNDSAGRAAALWTTFITLEAYLLVATGSVKHRDLFLDASIKLPVLGVDLPVTGYFFVAPIVLLIFHFYLLLQLDTLCRKFAEYSAVLCEQVKFEADRRSMILSLIDFPFLQYLTKTFNRTSERSGGLQRSISWLTIVLFPLAIFLQFQLAFLPYHDQWITWSHRLCIAADIGLLCFFWLRLRFRPDTENARAATLAFTAVTSSILISFSWLIATYPGEWMYRNFAAVGLDRISAAIAPDPSWIVSRYLFEGDVDGASGRPDSLFANRIILPGERIFDVDKHSKTNLSVAFRGRDLRNAVLQRADLRKADFTGANLRDASFVGASLQGAQFGCAPKVNVDQETLIRRRARTVDCDPKRVTILHFADFTEAKMQGAVLDNARLHGARLTGASAQGASFDRANMTAVLLVETNLQGASLVGADLLGAYIFNAHLQGADLRRASLGLANLYSAQLQGANILGADFTTALIGRTNLYRAYGSNRNEMDELCKSAVCEGIRGSPDMPMAFSSGSRRYALGGYDGEDQIRTLDARGYKLLLTRAVYGLENDGIKTLVTSRIAGLDPAKVVNEEKQVVIDGTFGTEKKLAASLKHSRTEAACQSMCEGAEAPLIVRAMVYNNRIYNLSNGGLALITFLQSRQCLGAQELEAEFRRGMLGTAAQIRSLRARREGAGGASDAGQDQLQCKNANPKVTDDSDPE